MRAPTASDGDRRPGGRRPEAGGVAVSLGLAALTLVWLVGTPVLGYGAMITAAPFFGEVPSPDQVTEAQRLGWATLGCALLAPLAGVAVAAGTRRRGAAWLFVAALTVSGLVGVATGVLSVDTARALRDALSDAPVDDGRDQGSPASPPACVEHSGGDTRCPGG